MTTKKSKVDILILCAVCLILAFLGSVDSSDQISHWILHFVENIPGTDFYKPYRLPPPSDHEYGFRPLSVLVLKLYLEFFDASQTIPLSIIYLKIFLSSFLLAISSYLFFQMNGLGRRSLFWSIVLIFASPHLFGLWRLSEFDGLGAAFILFAIAILMKKETSKLGFGLAALSSLCAIYLKESSALMFFSMFVAVILHHHLSGDTKLKFRFGWFLIVSLFLWCFQAQELLLGQERSLMGEKSIWERFPVVLFTSWQLLYFVSIPGTLLIGITFFRLQKFKYALPLGASLLFLLPPISTINHFETIYFSPFALGFILTIVFYGWLVYEGFVKRNLQALLVLSTQVVMWFAILFSATPREDMATRIFLPALPSLMILMDHVHQQLKTSTVINENVYSKKSLFLFEFLILWYFGAQAYNTIIERRVVDPQNLISLNQLKKSKPSVDSLILYNNYSFSLSDDNFFHQESISITNFGLNYLGASAMPRIQRDILRFVRSYPHQSRTALYKKFYNQYQVEEMNECLLFLKMNHYIDLSAFPQTIYVPDMLNFDEPAFPNVTWGLHTDRLLELEREYQKQTEIWLFWSATRPTSTKLQSYKDDFSYTRRPMGAMDTIYKEDSTSLPKHNFIEDMYIVSNSSEPTPLFELVQSRGVETFQLRTLFWKLPVNLPQIFQEFFIYGTIPLQHEAINYVYLVNENKKKDIK